MKHNNEISMKWIEVYDYDQYGNKRVIGYTCSKCQFYSTRKLIFCPFCKKRAKED